MTLETPPSPSNKRTPSFTGTASAETQVVVAHLRRDQSGRHPGLESDGHRHGRGLLHRGRQPRAGDRQPHLHGRGHSGKPGRPGEGESERSHVRGRHRSAENEPADDQRRARKSTTPTFRGKAQRTGDGDGARVRGQRSERHRSRELQVAARRSGRRMGSEASPALPDGAYTAQATEPSALGNGTGKSETRTFEIDTEPPEVTLQSAPRALERRTNRRSAGRSSEAGTVTVRVYHGQRSERHRSREL